VCNIELFIIVIAVLKTQQWRPKIFQKRTQKFFKQIYIVSF